MKPLAFTLILKAILNMNLFLSFVMCRIVSSKLFSSTYVNFSLFSHNIENTFNQYYISFNARQTNKVKEVFLLVVHHQALCHQQMRKSVGNKTCRSQINNYKPSKTKTMCSI